jgi:hypothetical protein
MAKVGLDRAARVSDADLAARLDHGEGAAFAAVVVERYKDSDPHRLTAQK